MIESGKASLAPDIAPRQPLKISPSSGNTATKGVAKGSNSTDAPSCLYRDIPGRMPIGGMLNGE